MTGLGTTAAGCPTQSQPDTDVLVTGPDRPARQRKHPFFERLVTPAHRRTLFTEAVELLAARLPASQTHLDPVIHYTPWVNDFLDWLDAQPGDTYQDRWLASGADSAGRDWLDVITSDLSVTYARLRFNRGLEAVVCCGVIRPSYGFLLTVWSNRLWSTWREEHDTELFSLIRETAAEELGRRPEMTASTLIDFARMSIRTGKALGELTCTDLLDYRQACIDAKGPGTKISWATTYYCGRAAGLFGDGPNEFQALLTARQLSPAEMVDHHHIASPSMRRLLSEYLAERHPSLDYTSFSQLAHRLCVLFWRDIENHHPGIESHHLTREQIEDWKARVMVLADGSVRRRPGEVFGAVRSFYLDINHWANDEPERWAH